MDGLWLLMDRWEQLLFKVFTDTALAAGKKDLDWSFERDMTTREDGEGNRLTEDQIKEYMGAPPLPHHPAFTPTSPPPDS
jgi:hypothetical protein